MKVLVTGSSGMLGRALCEVLSEEHELVGVDVKETSTVIPAKAGIHKFYQTDLLNKDSLEQILDKENPGLVIHAAACTDVDGCEEDPDKAERTNVLTTQNLAEIIEKSKIKLIYISTDFVFSGGNNIPYKEEDEADPINIYGKTKLEGEKIIRKMLSNYVIIRTSWLYGPGGKNFVDSIIDKSKTERYLDVVSDQTGSPTYTKDLAVAVELIVENFDRTDKETFHISNSGQCSWFEFAKEIFKNSKDIEINPITSSELNRPAPRPGFSVLDISKFEQFTKHKMRSWQEALREYLKEKEKI